MTSTEGLTATCAAALGLPNLQGLRPALKPGRVIRVTFSPGLTRFTIYLGLTRIGSREKRNCSFDDEELINTIA